MALPDRWWSWTRNTLTALGLLGLAVAPILPDLGIVLLAEIVGETAEVVVAENGPAANALTTGSIDVSITAAPFPGTDHGTGWR